MEDSGVNESNEPQYKSLRELRIAGVAVGVLATAIEAHGIYAWDRFNRFLKFEPAHAFAVRALDALAESVRPRDLQHGSSDDDARGSPWIEAGWPDEDCPDFAALARGLKVRKSGAEAVPTDSALLLIEAMRTYCVPRHFGSNEMFISNILERYPGMRGLSQRTVQHWFSQAGKTAADRGKERAVLPSGQT